MVQGGVWVTLQPISMLRRDICPEDERSPKENNNFQLLLEKGGRNQKNNNNINNRR